jgi:amidohydrolase
MTIDPVLVAAELVTALHHIVSRRINPVEPSVITVGTFQAGTKENIIADSARLSGTVRAFNESVREQLQKEIQRVTEGITSSWGATFDIEYVWGYPMTTNEAEMSELAARAAERVLGKDAVGREAPPIMGAEDFSRYLGVAPGAFAWLGAGKPEVPELERPLAHSAGFMMEESALPIGLAWYLSLVTNFSDIRAEMRAAAP